MVAWLALEAGSCAFKVPVFTLAQVALVIIIFLLIFFKISS